MITRNKVSVPRLLAEIVGVVSMSKIFEIFPLSCMQIIKKIYEGDCTNLGFLGTLGISFCPFAFNFLHIYSTTEFLN